MVGWPQSRPQSKPTKLQDQWPVWWSACILHTCASKVHTANLCAYPTAWIFYYKICPINQICLLSLVFAHETTPLLTIDYIIPTIRQMQGMLGLSEPVWTGTLPPVAFILLREEMEGEEDFDQFLYVLHPLRALSSCVYQRPFPQLSFHSASGSPYFQGTKPSHPM